MSSNRFLKPKIVKKKLNSTISTCSNLNETASSSNSASLNSECRMMYSRYLQAVFMKQYHEKKIEKNVNTLFKQLCIVNNRVQKDFDKNDKLKAKINFLQLQNDINFNCLELNNDLENIVGDLKKSDVLNNFQKIINILTVVCSRLYLVKNCEPLTNQEEYNNLEEMFKKSLNIAEELSKNLDVSMIDKMLVLVNKCEDSLCLAEKEKSALPENLISEVFLNLSNKLVAQKENLL